MEAIDNFRDLHDASSARIRPGVLLRSGQPSSARQPMPAAIIDELSIRTVVDLREDGDHELRSIMTKRHTPTFDDTSSCFA